MESSKEYEKVPYIKEAIDECEKQLTKLNKKAGS